MSDQCSCGVDLPVHQAGVFTVTTTACFACSTDTLTTEAAWERARRVDDWVTRAGSGGRLRSLSLDTFPDQAKTTAARRWLANGTIEPAKDADGEPLDIWRFVAPNLILKGPVGVGKTGIAWGIIRHLIEHHVEGMMLNVRDWLAELKRTFDNEAQRSTRHERIPVLCLDDLGAERPTAWAREELATVVEKRYQAVLPTIVTTNYELSDLARRIGHDDLVIGQRIVSRLTEGAVTVTITGTDRRRG